MKRKYSGGKFTRSVRPRLANVAQEVALRAIPPQYRLPARAAVYLGKKVYSAYRNRKNVQRVVPKAKPKKGMQMYRVRRGGFGGLSTGFYGGKFKKPSSARKGQGMEKVCQKKGHLINLEVHGDVADPDCVYITHNTYSTWQYAKVMAYAMVRKLLIKGGFNPDSVDQEIPFYDYNNADGFKIQSIHVGGDGTRYPTTYITVDDDTLATILTSGKFALVEIINALLVANDGGYLERLSLYSSDRNGVSTNWRLAAEINLEREVITLYASSSLVIQNRTKAAGTGADASIERVDNQPLKGYTYICAGACPKTQSMAVTQLDQVDTTGIQLARGAQLNGSLKEPPLPNYFVNCYKRGFVQLEPGQMKTVSIYFKFKGFFNDVVGRLRPSGTGTGSSRATQLAPGKCQVFALEERLNSGSTNNITVSYECQKRYGCYFTTSKKSSMLAAYDSAVLSNVP